MPGTGDDDKKEGSEMTMAEKKEAERLRYEDGSGYFNIVKNTNSQNMGMRRRDEKMEIRLLPVRRKLLW